jgi:hypothetical protein
MLVRSREVVEPELFSLFGLVAPRPLDDAFEFGPNLSGDGSEVGVLDEREHSFGVDRGDVGLWPAPRRG